MVVLVFVEEFGWCEPGARMVAYENQNRNQQIRVEMQCQTKGRVATPLLEREPKDQRYNNDTITIC